MADLITISDQASKSIRENLYPTLAENWRRTSNDPILRMYDFEAEDQVSGTVNKPRVNPASVVQTGREIEVVHEHSLYGGGYGVNEDVSLIYGKRAEDRSKATTRFYEGAFKISLPDIAATRDDKFSLVREVGRHGKNSVIQTRKDVGRMLAFYANGVLCYVNGAVTASTIVNVDFNATTENDPVAFLRPSKKVWIGTQAQVEAGTADEHEVNVIRSRLQFSVTTAGTFADNDRIVSKGVYAGAAYREFETFDNLINNTGTIQNVNKANNYWFQSDVTAVGGALAVSNIDTMARNVYEFSPDPTKQFLVANKTNWGRYAALLTANRRTLGHREDFTGMFADGASGLSYFAPAGEVPLFLSPFVPDGYMYMVDPNGYAWSEMKPLTFLMDPTVVDGVPGVRIPGSTSHEFAFVLYGQQVQLSAKSSGRLTGITA